MEDKMEKMMKMFEASEQRMASEMQSLKTVFQEFKPEILSIKGVVDTMGPEMAEIKANLEQWKPEMESKVGDLGAAVKDLRRQVDQIARGVGLSALGPPPVAAPPPTGFSLPGALPDEAHSGPSGHRVINIPRGEGSKELALSFPSPVAGQHASPDLLSPDMNSNGDSLTHLLGGKQVFKKRGMLRTLRQDLADANAAKHWKST
ncbi:hypothetical protein QYE76_060143 [Lolium multiflorum]|uniref:Uncharacterized protein n=1 Tax=Lolium multiflorum TaxID=4521 RepID=A0AAD8RZW3_LOLMU|nr:hypothetical protein QYE76_060143 [Lolium multiflorum]